MEEYSVWMEPHFLTQLFTPAWMATSSMVPPPGSVLPMAPGLEHSPTAPVSYFTMWPGVCACHHCCVTPEIIKAKERNSHHGHLCSLNVIPCSYSSWKTHKWRGCLSETIILYLWTAACLAQGPLYRAAALVSPRGECEKVGWHKSVICTLMEKNTAFKATDTSGARLPP